MRLFFGLDDVDQVPTLSPAYVVLPGIDCPRGRAHVGPRNFT